MKKDLLKKLNEYQSRINDLESIKSNLRDRSTCVLTFYCYMKNEVDVHMSLEELLYTSYNEDTDETKIIKQYNTNRIDPNFFNEIVDFVKSLCDKYIKKYEEEMDEIMKESVSAEDKDF